MTKKIGTITFHWATNYGAVLQAYALQKFLINEGFDSEIINYVPFRVTLIQRFGWLKNKSREMIIREKKLNDFRRKHLNCSKKVSFSKSLKKFSDTYDAILCGSDQIWNESFTLSGEGKPTLAYFLDFAGNKTRRIGYAVSFGTENLSDEYKKCVSNEFNKFYSVATRELSGLKLCKELGKDAVHVCDPTLLLCKKDYYNLIENINTEKVFKYVLHQHEESNKIADYILNKYNCKRDDTSHDGLIEWLSRINCSDLVVTNSYHGVMLSLILNKPFVAVLIKNSGMNDRIITILSLVGLEDRIIMEYETNKIDNILLATINWNEVNRKLEKIRNSGIDFIKHSLES